MNEELKSKIEKGICNLTENGLEINDIDILSKLVDIHKDLENEEYWNVKKEALEMKYRDYDDRYDYDYDRKGRMYGRDGRKRVYRGEDKIENMHENYRDYVEGRDEMGRGNYGAESATMKSLDYMLKSVVDFLEMLQRDATTDEEIDLIKKYSRKISEM